MLTGAAGGRAEVELPPGITPYTYIIVVRINIRIIGKNQSDSRPKSAELR